MSNAKSFNIRYVLTFKKTLDVEAMKMAVRKALDVYEEFSLRIVVKDNRFEGVHSGKIPFFYETDDIWDTRTFDLATDELNGFPFYFQYEGNKLLISCFHGLTDIVGMNSFIGTILYFYGLELGLLNEEEKTALSKEVVCSRERLDAIGDDVRYDPYMACGDPDVQPGYVREETAAYYLSDNKKDHMYYEEIEIYADEYVKEVDRLGSSFVGLTMVLAQQALRRSYDTKDENVTVMLPINQRPYFGTSGIKTNVNCSDSIMVDYTASMSKESLEGQCAYTKECFERAIRRDTFIKMAGDKNKVVLDFENSGRSALDIANEVQAAYDESGFNGLTFVVTSPGRFVLPSALDGLLLDIDINSYAAAHSFLLYTFRNSFRIKYASRNDSLTLMDALKEELGRLHIGYNQRRGGILKGDKLYLKNLKREGIQ